MEMVMAVPLLPTIQAKGKILLPIVCNYPVYQPIFVQAVQGPVNGGPIHFPAQLRLQPFMAKGFPAIL
jgi:hypothetical protein